MAHLQRLAARAFTLPLTRSSLSFGARHFSSYRAPPVQHPRTVALNGLAPLPGATHAKMRVGRGTGSGKGKTAGRGHKGSKSRNSRGLKPWFIGGQTPLYKLLPKRGFQSRRPELDIVNLDTIMALIASKRIDASQTITMKTLYEVNAISKTCKHGVKLLAKGYHNYATTSNSASTPLHPIRIQVSDASSAAKRAVESAGGSVELVYHNQRTLRYLLKPENFERPPRSPLPIPPPRLRLKFAQQLAGGETVKPRMGTVV